MATVAAVYDRRRSRNLLYCRRSIDRRFSGEPDVMQFLCKAAPTMTAPVISTKSPLLDRGAEGLSRPQFSPNQEHQCP